MNNKKPMRVAQIMGKLMAGGVESVVFNYYRNIDKTKVQFDFFYDADSLAEPPQDLIDMGARFYCVPPYQKLPQYISTVERYFKKNRYQIVHSHLNTLSVFPLYAAWRSGVPVRIAHNHSVPTGDEKMRVALKKVLKLFSRVFSTDYFACTEQAGRWLFGDKAYDEGRVHLIKNAINFDKFRVPEETVQKYREKLGLNGKFVIGHIGRFTYAKNHEFLLDIFEQILTMKENAVLMLVGDGELRDKIEAIIAEKGIEDSVVLVGQVTNPGDYYGLADVTVLPSRFEGLPLTAIESQIAGVPIVVSEVVPREAMVSNGCKHMKLNESAGAWAKAIIKMSEHEVLLSEHSRDYDIQNAAPKLTEWYLNRRISK